MATRAAPLLLTLLCLAASPAHAFLDGLLGGTPAKTAEAPPPVGDTLAKTGPFTSAAATGLAGYKTLWIPGQYTRTGTAQLYLGGQKYAAPGGYDDVVGFLPAPYGYFVAVHQPVGAVTAPAAPTTGVLALTPEMLAKMSPEQQIAALQLQLKTLQVQARSQPVVTAPPAGPAGQPYVVFYKVSAAGATLGAVAEVPSTGKAWVTPDAVFVAQPTAVPASRAVFNVVGYTTAGARVDGPQDAVSATPGPAGEWYWYSLKGREGMTVYREMDKSGEVKVLDSGDSLFAGIHFYDIYNSAQAFVDLPPLADSVRTGRVMYTSWDSGRGAIRSEPRGTLYLSPLNIAKYKEYAWLGWHRDRAALESMAERAGLFGTVGHPLYVGQASGDDFKEPGVNLYVLSATAPEQDHYALYNVMGRGMNVARSIFGDNNGGSFTLDAPNDVFVVITPKTTVAIKARAGETGIQGFDLVNRQPLESGVVYSFATKHGFRVE